MATGPLGLMLDTLTAMEPTTLASVLLMLSPKLKHSTMAHMDLVSDFNQLLHFWDSLLCGFGSPVYGPQIPVTGFFKFDKELQLMINMLF
jgi:hypothetical protein